MHGKSLLRTRKTAKASKPGLCPEPQYSPRTRAKQPETSQKRGGLAQCTSRRKSGQSRTIKNKTILPLTWSGLLDACLERAGLREDKDLHCEAWVLVTRATDTLFCRAGGKNPLQRWQRVEAFSTIQANEETWRKG